VEVAVVEGVEEELCGVVRGVWCGVMVGGGEMLTASRAAHAMPWASAVKVYPAAAMVARILNSAPRSVVVGLWDGYPAWKGWWTGVWHPASHGGGAL